MSQLSAKALFSVSIIGCLAAVCSAGLSFDGFKQYSLFPMSPEAVKKVHRLYRQYPSEPNPNKGLMFLSMPGERFRRVDLLVPPIMEADFLASIRAITALKVRLVHRNYGRLLAQFNRQNSISRRGTNNRVRRETGSLQPDQQDRLILRHDFYRSYSEIRRSLKKLNATCNQIIPGTCELIDIGTTYESRDLTVLRISKPSSPSAGNRTKIWIDGGIHAREWVSPATVLYMADQLISELASARTSEEGIVNKHDVMILPMLNPDGYEYSRLQNRFWRKNRQPTKNRRCRGVDLNRNYGFLWGRGGSSKNPCEITYRGFAAFSAAETAAVKRYLEAERDGLLMFLSFHSFGQYILMPFGHSRANYSITHDRKMRCAAFNAAYSIYSINSRFYTYGTGPDLMYAASGGSDDWAHGSVGIPYSFTIELPDEGVYGFLLPATLVSGVGEEAITGLRALLKTARLLESGDPEMAAFCSSRSI